MSFGNNILAESPLTSQDEEEDSDPSWWDDGDLLMAIDIGYDESGNGDILVVSAQLAFIEQAKKLKRQWKALLGNLEYWHSVDFDNYTQGVFSDAGLTRDNRGELLKDLAKRIHRHAIGGVSALVSISEYDRIIPKESVFRARTGTAYGFLISECLNYAHALLSHLGIGSDLNILIEDGHRNSQQAFQILGELKRVPPERLPIPVRILTVGLGSKVDHPILQAADMLAYCQWQHTLINGDRDIWNALHKPGMRDHSIRVVCDEQDIRRFCTHRDDAERVNWYLKKLKREEKNAAKANRVLQLRPDDAKIDKGSSQRDQGETGSGEASKGKKKAED